MKLYLSEIKENESVFDFNQDEPWLAQAVAQVDEKLESDSLSSSRKTPVRPIQVHLSMHQVDQIVVINGSIKTRLHLVCSRCAGTCTLDCHPQFSALYCKDPEMAGIGHLREDRGLTTPAGRNRGFARHAHDSDNDDESAKDIDINFIAEDYIDLADVITEQLQLQVPFQPLCKTDCKGMCLHCGTDLNQGRCACAKLTRSSPFSVLKDFKVKR